MRVRVASGSSLTIGDNRKGYPVRAPLVGHGVRRALPVGKNAVMQKAVILPHDDRSSAGRARSSVLVDVHGPGSDVAVSHPASMFVVIGQRTIRRAAVHHPVSA